MGDLGPEADARVKFAERMGEVFNGDEPDFFDRLYDMLKEHDVAKDARIETLEKALGGAADAAANEARQLAGHSVAQAVFHAVKAVARRALAGKEEVSRNADGI